MWFTKPKFNSGARLDQRPSEEKEQDYLFEEIVASVNPVNWLEKPKDQWRRFPIFNQDGSGSCVAQTMAKLLGILYWLKNKVYVHFSATHIYQRRINKPLSGMGGVDVFKIAQQGVTLEELVPSQALNDQQMDSIEIPEYKAEVGKVFKIGNYIIFSDLVIDQIASVIQTTGKGVMVWFYFDIPEWITVPVVKNPTLSLTAASTARHSVTAVDYTLYQGKKALIIEDSWGTSYGERGQRVITEDFFKARCFFAAYPMNFAFDSQLKRPKYTFKKDLNYSPSYSINEEVKIWQDILKYEGLFPSNIDSTGYFGAITRKFTYDYQVKHGLKVTGNLDQTTREYVNRIYG